MKNLLLILAVLFVLSCEDEGVRFKPTDNTQKTDTMLCNIKYDSVNINFFSTAVNRETYPEDDSVSLSVSGAMLVNQIELYSVYLWIKAKEFQTGTYDLNIADAYTRFTKTIGATTLSEVFAVDVSGKMIISEWNDTKLKGKFNFEATLTNKPIKAIISDGSFVHVIKKVQQ